MPLINSSRLDALLLSIYQIKKLEQKLQRNGNPAKQSDEPVAGGVELLSINRWLVELNC